MTPTCTIIPPFVRPTNPRRPCLRVANTTCRNADPLANPPRANVSNGINPVAPTATLMPNAPMPNHAGQNNRVLSNSVDALRHGNTGAIAISVSKAMPIGATSLSKNGSPTTMLRDCKASMTSGNTVPSKTTNANRANNTLLIKNAPSRDTTESILPGACNLSPRQPIKPTETITMMAKKASNHGPMALSLNACTLLSTPLRVRNVPRIVKLNVETSNERFHTRNMPRRSCTNTE